MSEKEKVHSYQKEDLTVFWKPKKCIHSKKCWKGLAEVFKPGERPWIQLENKSKAEIMAQIDKCPSAALSYAVEGMKASENESTVSAELIENGPLIVKGEMNIKMLDGTICKENNVALCRCGASTNKPYCDGSHNKVGFTG